MTNALALLDTLLGRPEPLDASECLSLVDALGEVPGRSRRVVERLASQRDAAALDALLRLPSGTAGVVEGSFAGFRRGVARTRVDGRRAERMLSIEFRQSEARRFGALLERAELAFAAQLEHLQADVPVYRVALFEDPSLRRRARELALELEALHRSLLRLRGVRVWINGWRVDDASPLRPPSRVALLRAWLDWASAEEPGA